MCRASVSIIRSILFQLSGTAFLYGGEVPGNSFPGPVPPLYFKQIGNGPVGKTLFNGPGGHPAHDGVGRNIFCDHRPGADDCPVTDGHASQYDRLIADPDIIADDDVSFIVPGRCHVSWVKVPLLKKKREGIG